MSKVSKNKFYMTIAIMCVVAIFTAILGYIFGNRNVEKGSRMEFVLTKNVEAGHPIKGCYKIKYLSSYTGISQDCVFNSEKDLKGMVAQIALHTNEQITRYNVCKKEDRKRNLQFSLAVDTSATIANSVSTGDPVAIKVKFDDERPDAVVVPYITIKNIKSSSGAEITDGSTEPGFLVFRVTNEESVDLNAASKEGTLYVVKYYDVSKAKLKKNYVIGTGDKNKNGNTNSSSANSNSSNSSESQSTGEEVSNETDNN